jgi:hypothetical protein
VERATVPTSATRLVVGGPPKLLRLAQDYALLSLAELCQILIEGDRDR